VVAGRLLSGLLVLIGVSLITFAVFNVLPGNAAQQLLGADATNEQVARLERELELHRPAWERYFDWTRRALAGDLGRSFASRQPVTTLLAPRVSATLELVAYALVLAIGFAVPMALLAAYEPNGLADRLGAVVSTVALSAPNYVLALLLVLVFAVKLRLFPSIGFVPLDERIGGNIQSLTLPAIALGVPLFGLYCRFLRSDLLEQMRSEAYIVTAAAKGIGRWRILVRHALPNSLFGFLTIVGLHIGTLIGGAVIIEEIFAIPGVGKLLLQAVQIRDVPVVEGVVLFLSTAAVTASLVVDLLYLLLDPRVRYGG